MKKLKKEVKRRGNETGLRKWKKKGRALRNERTKKIKETETITPSSQNRQRS
jgi:hypothetical protein